MRPRVIGHRGASGTTPENTLVAFRRAEELGADMVELDVQRTRDGEVVVIHDFTLDRTTDGTGRVGEHTLVELARLDAGSWFGARFRGERIPTLGQVLDAIALPVNVELKPVGDEGLEEQALAVVTRAGALDRVVFSSFVADALVRLRALSREAALAVLWEHHPLPEAVRLAEGVHATALHLRNDAATPDALALLASAGLPVRVWTVNDPDEFARLAGADVDGVFTDHPERFLLWTPSE
jgi:glycerophosphoryl diester phosphodiesterase